MLVNAGHPDHVIIQQILVQYSRFQQGKESMDKSVKSIQRSIDHARGTRGVKRATKCHHKPLESWRLHEQRFVEISGESGRSQFQKFIDAVFNETDSVCIARGRHDIKKHRDQPINSGKCETAEWWASNQNKVIQECLRGSRSTGGVFVRINPTIGACDNNVEAYRYCLCECDNGMPIEKQVEIMLNSRLPFIAITSSGGKSVHGWCLIGDCLTDHIYHRRRERVWATLKSMGFACDELNKNPSRFSRLPGAYRKSTGKMQELLYINEGNLRRIAIDWKVEVENPQDLGADDATQ